MRVRWPLHSHAALPADRVAAAVKAGDDGHAFIGLGDEHQRVRKVT